MQKHILEIRYTLSRDISIKFLELDEWDTTDLHCLFFLPRLIYLK